MAMVRHLLWSLMLVLLASCAAPTPQADAGAEPAAEQREASSPPATAKPPRMSTPLPPKRVPTPATPEASPKAATPAVLDTSCKVDADCAVKNVGNCCGYYPSCVNKDSPTNPAAVQAECQAKGMMSVCGFREISACTCNAGKCEAAGNGAVPVAQ